MAWVLVADTGDQSFNWAIPGDEPVWWVGRDPSCDVVLDSLDISRRHVRIAIEKEQLVVEDSSSNGTLIGEKRIKNETIQTSIFSEIRIGTFRLRVRKEGSEFPEAHANPHAGTSDSTHLTFKPALLQSASEPPEHRSRRVTRPLEADVDAIAHLPAISVEPIPISVRKRIQRKLIESLDLVSLDRSLMDDATMRPRVVTALRQLIEEHKSELPLYTDVDQFLKELADEALGLGPLESLIADPSVSEIMVVDPYTIYAEKSGKLELTPLRFTDDEAVRAVVERIVTPLGRRIDESSPLVDARLKDGSRVNAVIKPLALRGTCITIRKFSKKPLSLEQLIGFGAMSPRMGQFLMRTVKCRKNVVISGGTGSGKTTLLNVLSGAIPDNERIVTIEDAAELQMQQTHVVSLETRPANMEGKGEYSIRDLVKNALRMRPDRIVVGECRGGEALDMLQAMNTGHDGSMTTTHANSPKEAVGRLETLCLMSGLDLPARAIREQIASSVNVILQQTRFSDGSRRVSSISEIAGINDHGEIELREIFCFFRTGTGPDGKVLGEFRATGYIPSFIDDFIVAGLIPDGDFL